MYLSTILFKSKSANNTAIEETCSKSTDKSTEYFTKKIYKYCWNSLVRDWRNVSISFVCVDFLYFKRLPQFQIHYFRENSYWFDSTIDKKIQNGDWQRWWKGNSSVGFDRWRSRYTNHLVLIKNVYMWFGRCFHVIVVKVWKVVNNCS